MTERQHAAYGASNAHRWLVCHASIKEAAKAPPRPSSRAAREGTAAHALLEHCLKTGVWDARPYIGQAIDPEFPIDDMMARGVNTCLDLVWRILAENPGAELHVENQFEIPSLAAPGQVYGHCDICIFVPSNGWLIVIDFKYGYDVVDVKGNPQCLHYGTGAFFSGRFQNVQALTTWICQPRAYGTGVTEYHTYSVQEVYDFYARVEQAVADSKAENPTYAPSRERCKYCPANTTCAAARSAALVTFGFNDVKQVGEAVIPAPQDVDIPTMAHVLAHADMLRGWLDAYETHAKELLLQGVFIPGQKLVEAKQNRAWHGEEEQVAAALMRLIGLTWDEVMPRGLIPVTEAEKLAVDAYKARAPRGQKMEAAKAAREALAFLTHKPKAPTYTMASESDPRPAVNPVKQMFAGVVPSSSS
jgi:hypothetical protein